MQQTPIPSPLLPPKGSPVLLLACFFSCILMLPTSNAVAGRACADLFSRKNSIRALEFEDVFIREFEAHVRNHQHEANILPNSNARDTFTRALSNRLKTHIGLHGRYWSKKFAPDVKGILRRGVDQPDLFSDQDLRILNILTHVLPKPTDISYFERCGHNCFEGSRDLHRLYPLAPKLRLLVSDERQSSLIQNDTARALRIGQDDLYNRERISGFFLQWLTSHPLHPYSHLESASREPIALSKAQSAALAARFKSEQAGYRRFLVTGVDSYATTPVLLSHLREQWIAKFNHKSGLHVVLARSSYEVSNAIETIKRDLFGGAESTPRLISWERIKDSVPLVSLLPELNKQTTPSILVTTLPAFLRRVSQDTGTGARELASHLLSFNVDNITNSQAQDLLPEINFLMKLNPKLTLFGTRTLPQGPDQYLMELFPLKDYWLHLGPIPTEPKFRTPIKSLAMYVTAAEHGELTPLRELHLMTPETLEIDRNSLFLPRSVPSESNTKSEELVLNPQLLAKTFFPLYDLYRRKGQTLTLVDNSLSAEHVVQHLLSVMPHYRYAILSADTLPRFSVLQRFKDKQIDHLVVTDLPSSSDLPKSLDTLIDLTRSRSSMQMIERITKMGHLAEQKSGTTLAMLFGTTDRYLTQQIELLDRLLKEQVRTLDVTVDLRYVLTRPTLNGSSPVDSTIQWNQLRDQLLSFHEHFRENNIRTEAERIEELNAFVRAAHKAGRKLLPSAKAKDETEKSLGIALANFKDRYGSEWYNRLASDVIEYLREKDMLGPLKKTPRPESEWLKDIGAYIQDHRHERFVLPSKKSEIREVRSLGVWLKEYKKEKGPDWYKGLAFEEISILREKGHIK